jgi:hypothetical protein
MVELPEHRPPSGTKVTKLNIQFHKPTTKKKKIKITQCALLESQIEDNIVNPRLTRLCIHAVENN